MNPEHAEVTLYRCKKNCNPGCDGHDWYARKQDCRLGFETETQNFVPADEAERLKRILRTLGHWDVLGEEPPMPPQALPRPGEAIFYSGPQDWTPPPCAKTHKCMPSPKQCGECPVRHQEEKEREESVRVVCVNRASPYGCHLCPWLGIHPKNRRGTEGYPCYRPQEVKP